MKLLPPPGPERRRQLTQLALLLLGLLLVAWYQWPQAAPAVPASNVPTGQPRAVAALTLPAPVRLGDLGDAPPETAIGRNPFGFGERVVPRETSDVRQTMRPVEPLEIGPPVPQGPPPIALRLTGLMVGPTTDRTMATLKDPATGTLFHGFEGDVLDGRYRLVKVGTQSVVVSYVDGSGMRTLGLGN